MRAFARAARYIPSYAVFIAVLRGAGPGDRLSVIRDHIGVVMSDSNNERLYGPLKYPAARANLAACLEVLSIAGLQGAAVDDHVLSDSINDLPGYYEDIGKASNMLGECLLTQIEADLFDDLQRTMKEIFYTSSADGLDLLQDPRWIKARRCARELLRQITRADLRGYAGYEGWEEIRLRGIVALNAFPDTLDDKSLDR